MGNYNFYTPVKFGDSAVDGKSIANLLNGEPLYSPIEGLDKAAWPHPCSSCHQWTRERLCAQSDRYDRVDVSVLRLQHPDGSRFKAVLSNRARGV